MAAELITGVVRVDLTPYVSDLEVLDGHAAAMAVHGLLPGAPVELYVGAARMVVGRLLYPGSAGYARPASIVVVGSRPDGVAEIVAELRRQAGP